MMPAASTSETSTESATNVCQPLTRLSNAPGADVVCKKFTMSTVVIGWVIGVVSGEGPTSGEAPPSTRMLAGIQRNATSASDSSVQNAPPVNVSSGSIRPQYSVPK